MGNKATNLQILQKANIEVPRGFIVDASHYREATRPIEEQILDALPSTGEIASIFMELAIPENTVRHILYELASFGNTKSFAVRSSGMVEVQGSNLMEDSRTVSLAGQFDSFLPVRRDDIFNALKQCWASLYNARSIASFHPGKDYVSYSAMSVLIQEMIPATASAVMMTADPLGDGRTGGIELIMGPCEALVSGRASPDEVMFDRQGGSILRMTTGPKENHITRDSTIAITTAASVTPLPEVLRDELVVPVSTIKRIIELGYAVENIFGEPQDVEMVITPDNRIVVTQSRAITTLPMSLAPFRLPEAA